MMNQLIIHSIEILNLKHCKRWINPVQISKAMGSVEELRSVLIITRRDNIEQSQSIQHNQ